jgi:hypothetical protein
MFIEMIASCVTKSCVWAKYDDLFPLIFMIVEDLLLASGDTLSRFYLLTLNEY